MASQGTFADLRQLAQKPRSFAERIERTLDYYPADILFIHRDSERESQQFRIAEIDRAVSAVTKKFHSVPVVPVRMLEAWLLFDEFAIRTAAGNPNGRQTLNLPRINRVESIPDPKQVLFDNLKTASGLAGRRLKSFRPDHARSMLADRITDFNPLIRLPAFSEFHAAVKIALDAL